ncbi:Cytochrome c-type biogenesis protein CcmF [bioreactor metagenome]|uniref:Cytochrome c-type biogenesis protein CcmF n=1 Tax=bioreactor metagenome TaxID=1076179 RepID=A0A644U7S5_9ZZZZ|nr:heme lyase CcmF/NrfE family subunit [Desulfitobacterium hafniense]MEA5024587.1 heme lyase CcmF/NrfE family subunit [Desulfitobacterium hafniense]
MVADIGSFALLLALLTSAYALGAYIVALRKNEERLLPSAKGGVLAAAIFTTIASVSLIYLLMTGDFSIQYVASYTSSDLPAFYKLSAFWAGNDGSLLLWALILTILAAIVTYGRQNEDLKPYVGAVMMLVSTFFLFLLVDNSNPFAKLPNPLPEGNGLNPMLQNPGMVIHPVTLYLGYVGFTVPFAYAIAALFTRQTDDRWIKVTRKWTIISWLFLSLGNLFGAQWAYVELGWGGYWAWDPVENASLIPWLTSTAFLHSVMVQERKNMLKIWNMLLIIFTFGLTLFGTFLVRSGVVASVHAFGDSTLGLYFIVFTTVVIMGSLFLVLDRVGLLKQGNEFDSLVSKESSFLLNNLLFVASAFSILWGTIFPIVSEGFTGKKITVGAPFFNAINAPIGLAFVLLMGICPLIAWRKASIKSIVQNFRIPLVVMGLTGLILILLGVRKPYAVVTFSICAFVLVSTLQDIIKGIVVRHKMTSEGWLLSSIRLLTKNRRRYGGYVIHLGVVMMIIGIAGSNIYNQEFTKTLNVGEQINVGDYWVTYEGLQQKPRGQNMIISADLNVRKDDSSNFKLSPEKVFYPTAEQPTTEPAVKSTWVEDFYVTLAGWEKEEKTATIKVNINPLIKWLWTGGYVLILGTLFALWPGKGSGVGAKYLGRS